MGSAASKADRRQVTRYTPELKRELKAKAEARRAAAKPAEPSTPAPTGVAGDMVNGVRALKNPKSLRDRQIEEAGG